MNARFILHDIKTSIQTNNSIFLWTPEELMVRIRDLVNKYFTEVNDEDRG